MKKTFTDYLAARVPVCMGAMDGTLMQLHSVDVADWREWIDPAGTVRDFEGYCERTDYVPSEDLIYAVLLSEPLKWGSGETWTEAMADALGR